MDAHGPILLEMSHRTASILLLLSLTPLTGCLPSQQPPAKADFRATDTPAKVPAIVHASDPEDQASLPELIHALSDKDAAVRLFAIQSLQARTGQTLDYRYYEAADKRQAAIDRWHDWLKAYLAPEPITQETTE